MGSCFLGAVKITAAKKKVTLKDLAVVAEVTLHHTHETGDYSLSAATRQSIRRDGDHLLAERTGRTPQVLLPESGDVFFTPGRPRTRRIFTRAADGQVSGFADRREGIDLLWTRVAPETGAR